MTWLSFTESVSVFVGLGALLGIAYLSLLSWHVRALTGQSRGCLAVSVPLSRTALLSGAFLFSVFHGAAALIAALAGFLLSRLILLSRPELFVP